MSEPIRVLVVDDDPDELELLTARAASGEEAVKLVEGGRFSAAVLDLLMPRLNGFQTAALMRRTENGRGMPILILSGYDETASRRIEGWDEVSGRVQYLEKPFSAEALRERVAAAYSPAWKSSEGLAPSL
jgi:DNA-binding response OmpR family regulator